jgi:hypothetical protein
MSFGPVKSWDNRGRPVRLDPTTGRSWTRRIRWLEDSDGRIKLKLEDGQVYKEVVAVFSDAAQRVWDRFKDGQSIDDCVSILAAAVPRHLASRRATDKHESK